MLAISLLFVGITLILNGILLLQKTDVKSISIMNLITASIIIIGNFIAMHSAQSMVDYMNIASGFLFGFTYLIIAVSLLMNIDPKVNGWYSLMVAIYALLMFFSSIDMQQMNYAYLWGLWSILWASTFIENILNIKLGKYSSYLCIFEGFFAAFIPSIMMFFEKW